MRLRCLVGWHKWHSIMHTYRSVGYAQDPEGGWFEQRCRHCDAPWKPRPQFPITLQV
ncbi:hypothetical protein [Nocardia sp.]|uniref:hypothetical protein n=1 Tax=Nocardia sp. TaxID=1821 RepID=UPI002582E41F|nr:hypothetical protein [Nocardia sp.]